MDGDFPCSPNHSDRDENHFPYFQGQTRDVAYDDSGMCGFIDAQGSGCDTVPIEITLIPNARTYMFNQLAYGGPSKDLAITIKILGIYD